MKQVFIALVATVALFSCKQAEIISNAPAQNGPGNYRAGFVSKSSGDTTWTATRNARIETIGLDSAADSKLKIVLLSYDGHGIFTFSATNLTSCQGIIRWNWDGNFKIDSVGYPSNNPLDPSNDVLKAGQTKIFKIYSFDPKPGRIKVKLENDGSGGCSNSSTLIINITTTLLPITYTGFSVAYNDELQRVFVSFNIMQPADLRCVVIQHLDGAEYKTVLVALGDDNITTYNIKLP